MIINNRFDIDDIVYHITPESDLLIVVDYRCYSDGTIEYLVTSSVKEYAWIRERELSPDKRF